MIHIWIGLYHVVGPSLATALTLLIGISLYLFGGPLMLGMVTALSLLMWIVPSGAPTIGAMVGIAAVAYGVIALVMVSVAKATSRTLSSYRKAARAGNTAAWWKPTLTEKLFDRRYMQPWDDRRDGRGITAVTRPINTAPATGRPAARMGARPARPHHPPPGRALRRSSRPVRPTCPADEDDGT